MPAIYRVGTSGWSYRHWDGDFYPRELPNNRWLGHYARHFDTVEVNASFQPPAACEDRRRLADALDTGPRRHDEITG